MAWYNLKRFSLLLKSLKEVRNIPNISFLSVVIAQEFFWDLNHSEKLLEIKSSLVEDQISVQFLEWKSCLSNFTLISYKINNVYHARKCKSSITNCQFFDKGTKIERDFFFSHLQLSKKMSCKEFKNICLNLQLCPICR